QQSAPLDEARKIPYEIKDDLETQSEAEALHRAIEELPPQEKKIVEMKYEQDMPIREIAHTLHKNENTIKLALFRIRNKLKKNKYLMA
nr:sigma-70 family RNA polymerase sigma factor [bacterium]